MNTGHRFIASVAAALAVVFFGGCSTATTGSSVKYSFDPQFGFPDAKTYRWAESATAYGWDPLLPSE